MPESAPSSRKRVRTSIGKACDECRRRKTKCNGGLPCDTCRKYGGTCHFRSYVRRRKRGLASSSREHCDPQAEEDEGVEKNLEVSQQPLLPSLLPGDEQYGDHITATDNSCLSSSPQLYYGPPSNFAFLQQIYQQLKSIAKAPFSSTNPRADDGDTALDWFGYRRLFFGNTSSDLISRSSTQMLIVPEHLANSFVDLFISTLGPFFPFISRTRIEGMLQTFYSFPNTSSGSALERGILMAILALGATLTEHVQLGEDLFLRAKSEMHTIEDLVNVQAVQLPLLTYDYAHYQAVVGRINSAYLHLGTAVRKAHAAGLHRAASSLSVSEFKEERVETFWSLSMTSFSLGRPAALSENTISVGYPTKPSFLRIWVEIASLASTASHTVYRSGGIHSKTNIEAAWDIHRKLQAIKLTLEHKLQFDLQSSAHPTLEQLQQTAEKVPASENIAPPWLLKACQVAVFAAQELIAFASRAAKANSLINNLRYNAYYIESACFVLVWDTLRDKDTTDKNFYFINTALYHLRQMIPSEAISCSVFAIERMLSAISQLTSEATASAHQAKSSHSVLDMESLDSELLQQPSTDWMLDIIESQLSVDDPAWDFNSWPLDLGLFVS
ncbi:uncharacterized protein EAF02_001494 [Botrytis sinoallii]|uniref:uncharacterized protein n=1 Tax=Botrytis sinoallii TaxID=1463999 RepID=UPI0018FF875F|nr:uncharacterized protein EAF02_001494 [Botrytis sinoallii]KAF7891169.1 hypothetical protein EAF02_001494 [Botrytis sinoallii]